MKNNTPDILTPDQAAAYLQVNRETIYRYIRDGKLVAAKLGRSYRIPRRSVELLLLASRTRPDIPTRLFSDEEITQFLDADRLDSESVKIVERFSGESAATDAG